MKLPLCGRNVVGQSAVLCVMCLCSALAHIQCVCSGSQLPLPVWQLHRLIVSGGRRDPSHFQFHRTDHRLSTPSVVGETHYPFDSFFHLASKCAAPHPVIRSEKTRLLRLCVQFACSCKSSSTIRCLACCRSAQIRLLVFLGISFSSFVVAVAAQRSSAVKVRSRKDSAAATVGTPKSGPELVLYSAQLIIRIWGHSTSSFLFHSDRKKKYVIVWSNVCRGVQW